MRNPRKNKSFEFDMKYPIPKDNVQHDDQDCFSNEWNPETKECSVCADSEVCGIMYQDKMTHRIKNKSGTFLDQANVKIDIVKIKKLIKQTCEASNPITKEELFEYFKTATKIQSDLLIITLIKNLIRQTPELYIENGKVLWRAK